MQRLRRNYWAMVGEPLLAPRAGWMPASQRRFGFAAWPRPDCREDCTNIIELASPGVGADDEHADAAPAAARPARCGTRPPPFVGHVGNA